MHDGHDVAFAVGLLVPTEHGEHEAPVDEKLPGVQMLHTYGVVVLLGAEPGAHTVSGVVDPDTNIIDGELLTHPILT